MSDKRPNLEDVEGESPDQLSELLHRLKVVVPEVFTDGKLDLDRLRALAGDAVEEGPERYGLNWPGKREAIAMLQAPSRATLVPDLDESVNFNIAQHVFIEGENLEVLKLLYRAYFGRVKLIYIDPPYNTASDFIYPDDFSDPLGRYLSLSGQISTEGDLLTSKPEQSGRKHSGWLSMMYPRIALARQFLREDGFLVVSIDDIEVSNLRRLLDELFGEENFVATLVYDRNRKNDAKLFSVGHEYMLVFARNRSFLKELDTQLRAPKEGIEELRAEFERLKAEHGDDWKEIRSGLLEYYGTFGEDDPRQPLARYTKVDSKGPYRDDGNINWPGGGGPRYEVLHPDTGKPCKLPRSGWRFPTIDRFLEEKEKGRIVFGKDETTVPSIRYNAFETDTQVMHSVAYSYAQTASQQFDAIFDDKKVFDNPKSYADLERLVSYLSGPDDVIMDFFAGSNTAMHGVIRANENDKGHRKMISVQMPQIISAGTEAGDNARSLGFEKISDIARDRIRRVVTKSDLEDRNAGFRAFRLVASAARRWTGTKDMTPEAYEEQIEAFADSLEPGWREQDVIWEAALREGLSLTSKVQRISSGDPAVWRVSDEERDRHFTICLADTLTLEQVQGIDLGKDDLFICRDSAMDDTLAANLALQCRLKVL